ncbi:MAG TPA: hypothetical protein VMB03_05550 [Bryobacteraceae bacterium]|nr:hypothetical protein [Bryobacteraceae bacterium]
MSTAWDETSGSRNCSNVLAQTLCQWSVRSSNARIAPASIRALSLIALPQSLAHCSSHILRPVRIAAGYSSEAS